MDTQQAEDLFNKTAGSAIRALRLIGSLRECLRCGIPLAHEKTLESLERIAVSYLSSPDFGTPQQRDEAMRAMPAQVAEAAQNTINDAVMTADAACIVFAHSMVDGAVENYCAISAVLGPEDWFGAVKGDKITLAEARNEPPDKVLRDRLDGYLKKLSRESLLTKIEHLQKACQPGRTEIRKGYVFDATKIVRIDRMRHAIVHERFGVAASTVNEDIDYLQETQFYLAQLITHRYGTMLGPELFIDAQR